MTSELPLCSRGIDLASEVLWLQNALKTIIMLIAVRRALQSKMKQPGEQPGAARSSQEQPRASKYEAFCETFRCRRGGRRHRSKRAFKLLQNGEVQNRLNLIILPKKANPTTRLARSVTL